MTKNQKTNPVAPNLMAVLGWLMGFFPFFAFFGFFESGFSAWLINAYPVLEGSLGGALLAVHLPEALQGLATSFLGLYVVLNIFKKADTFVVTGAAGVIYLIFAIFLLSRQFELPPDFQIFSLEGYIASPLGVLLGLGAFALHEYRIRTLDEKLTGQASQ